ncbi:MAG: (deoxy)nucleoside triphosphate pyrophosphohydrolase [Acidobacteriota bacterium]|nr:(deoxy)nucleoside triphosphate pyrophosphohydrolase [Acidobacteriota bacterium]
MLQVTAAVIERDGLVLIARRRAGGRFGGVWEFPGGKVEPGEEPRDGLRREIREELDLAIDIGACLGEYPFASPSFSLVLIAFRAGIRGGVPVLHDHDEMAWVRPAELAGYTFAEPDLPLVERLRQEAAHG